MKTVRRFGRWLRAHWYRGECLVVVKRKGSLPRILAHKPGRVQEFELLAGEGKGPVYLTIIPKYQVEP
jgi:hypothetical protein